MKTQACLEVIVGAVTMSEWKPVYSGMAGTIGVGGDLTVNRLGFGAMRLTGDGIWGKPADPDEAKAILRHVESSQAPVKGCASTGRQR